ncbi:MerR family transcriptional regulator [Nocardia terpenica]|uniref:MerR family transcriptional regulator n=1 Tax=Nocardia terpenica TaxID=455432 RepID=UPI0018941379|nr:MerR family transcriptional regulator [Nocardia terpenica]MBF6065090.1 MerR family transcriptional regulator [Nocardia terpenica]MBF6108147.1 MerR family transcriptional regulator [Nocardia terpenica]MBF6115362.1 MerR family transcriptional regulator [Nocardia terpenica]MBF6122684.1 MerR family transcriptional regulator [Nocardia terpenica]
MGTEAEWSIQELARAAGTTSRTLRHYGAVGLLPPSRVGANGYRYYDRDSLVRLQRILLLRELGLGLPVIAEVLAEQRDTAAALRTHLELLRQERDRISRQIASVQSTLHKTEAGEPLMAAEVFDGFDHARYKDEVIERWGREAYESSDRWWNSMSEAERRQHMQTHADIAADYGRAHRDGLAPDSEPVQNIVARHFDWVRTGWGGRRPTRASFTGLGEMYVADPRFAANYDRHGAGTAAFVRDAMKVYADNCLE